MNVFSASRPCSTLSSTTNLLPPKTVTPWRQPQSPCASCRLPLHSPGGSSALSTRLSSRTKNHRALPVFSDRDQSLSTSGVPSGSKATTTTTVPRTKMMSISFPSETVLPAPLYPGTRRLFQPLNPEKRKEFMEKVHRQHQNQGSLPTMTTLRGIIFDVDGTLCLPQNYMFAEMRSALSIPRATDILAHINSLPTAAHRHEAFDTIRSIERAAMSKQQPQPHLIELMSYLEDRKIRKGICTRNFPSPVEHLLQKFLGGITFEGVVTRESVGLRAKPEGDGIWWIVEGWDEVDSGQQRSGVDAEAEKGYNVYLDQVGIEENPLQAPAANPGIDNGSPAPIASPYVPLLLPSLIKLRHSLCSDILMVGDSIDDMLAGRNAGAATCLLLNEHNRYLIEDDGGADGEADGTEIKKGTGTGISSLVDLAVESLGELIEVLDHGFMGRVCW